MLYPANFFDNCNGLIPQIVLCVMLLQAGNEKKLQFPAAFTKDTSDSAIWDYSQNESSSNGLLNIGGYLPLMESSYLLTKPSLVSRISALSPFNVNLLSESVGVPFGSFTNDLPVVELPAGIDHLSTGELVVETRLAYLLLELERRNNLYSLYNWLNYTRIAATVKLVSYQVITGSALVDTTTPAYGQEVLSLKIVNLCIDALFKTHSTLEKIIYGSAGSDNTNNRLEEISIWAEGQFMTPTDRVPNISSADLYSTISSDLETLRFNGVKAIEQISASGDVGSGFGSGGASVGGEPNPEPPSGGGESNTTSPTEDPDRSYASLSGNSPVNTLPEC